MSKPRRLGKGEQYAHLSPLERCFAKHFYTTCTASFLVIILILLCIFFAITTPTNIVGVI